MKKNFIILTCLAMMGLFSACNKTHTFNNPILAGFYPDPSVCKAEGAYYLVTSTFGYFPGVPIFKSTDMVNWEHIGHVLDRPEQLELNGLDVSSGIFAPTVSYHKGTFYMTTTNVRGGGNFIVTATDPAGPWSNPHWLPQVDGIDPSLFFDNDDRVYIVFNSGPPENKSLYSGHRAIWMYEVDINEMKTIGQRYLLLNGGVDISTNPVWIEGPHIYKENGYYYLMAAEGGTSIYHSEVICRSKSVTGEYVPWEKNPILTQRHLDPKRENPITATGHADLIQMDNGEWWAVFLACRPYPPSEQDYYNIGRETYLAPVKWEDNWPIINPDFEEVQYKYKTPNNGKVVLKPTMLSGNFSYREEFNSDNLPMEWIFLKTPRKKWYSLEDTKGSLSIELQPETCSGLDNPAFIARRQQHVNCAATTQMSFTPSNENELAGLVSFQNESHYYMIGKTLKEGEQHIQLLKSFKKETPVNSLELGDKINTNNFHKAYKTERHGQEINFAIEVDRNKQYTIQFLLAESYWNDKELRMFDIVVDGEKKFENIDLYVEAGKDNAIIKSVEVVSTGSHLNIQLISKKDHAAINGIIVSGNNENFYFNCGGETFTSDKGELFISDKNILSKSSVANKDVEILTEVKIGSDNAEKPVLLKIAANGKDISFYYAFDNNDWKTLAENEDGTFLSTKVAGGFVGATFGLYGTSQGIPSENKALFDWFEYAGNDEIFK